VHSGGFEPPASSLTLLTPLDSSFHGLNGVGLPKVEWVTAMMKMPATAVMVYSSEKQSARRMLYKL